MGNLRVLSMGKAVDTASVRCCSSCGAIYRSDYARCPNDGAEIAVLDKDPLIRTTVAEHYVIDGVLGEGTTGRVYRAYHSRLRNKQYAVKILVGDLAASPTMRMRFAHEAEIASKLSHPNIVGVNDFGRSANGLLFLAMDLVEGPTLGEIIAEGPLDPVRVVQLAKQLAAGLAHAHSCGLVHRDFKPDNILVIKINNQEVPRIVDFGLAISTDDTDARLTPTGVALGTPVYAAPEQGTGTPIDHRVDLYALGVTMYEMLTGTTPFDGQLLEVMAKKATQDPPPMDERAPHVLVPPELSAIVMRLVARAPEDRLGDASDVIAALEAIPRPSLRMISTVFVDGLEAEAEPVGVAGAISSAPGFDLEPPTIAPQRAVDHRGRRLIIGVSAGAMLVAVVALWWLSANQKHRAPSSTVAAARSPAHPAAAGTPTPHDPPAPAPAPVVAIADPVTPPAPVPAPVVETPPTPTPVSPAPARTITRVASPTPAARRTQPPTPPAHKGGKSVPAIAADTHEPAHVETPADHAGSAPVGAAGSGGAIAVATPQAPPPMPTTVVVPASAIGQAGSATTSATPAPSAQPTAPLPPAQLMMAVLDVDTRGSLAPGEVQRAFDRVLPSLRACTKQIGIGTVTINFTVGDSRRAGSISASGAGGGAGCVKAALSGFRTDDAPDVGDVEVAIKVGVKEKQ